MPPLCPGIFYAKLHSHITILLAEKLLQRKFLELAKRIKKK